MQKWWVRHLRWLQISYKDKFSIRSFTGNIFQSLLTTGVYYVVLHYKTEKFQNKFYSRKSQQKSQISDRLF